LHDLHASQRSASSELETHLSWLGTLPMFAGVSDHDLIYSKVRLLEAAGAPISTERRNGSTAPVYGSHARLGHLV
jgi:hypothetical protein